MQSTDIYDPKFVKGLFNEMSSTYGITNYISSFGFCQRWREKCIGLSDIKPGMRVYDLMTGMGECWHLINQRLQNEGELVALDFSEEMCTKAYLRKKRMPDLSIEIIKEDFLDNELETESADCIVSAFGLKTFSEEQMRTVANEIARILRPGGNFSLLEISVPRNPFINYPYMKYLKYCIPFTGKILLGNPNNYRMLGIYTELFGDCKYMASLLKEAGLSVSMQEFFYGCSTAVCGVKAT